MASEGLICWQCGKPTGFDKVARSSQCPHCLSDLRCCHGCRHYDPSKRWQCRETIDSPVQPKDRSNFCDFFQTRLAVKGAGTMRTGRMDTKDDRKKRFDDLFDD